MLLIKMCPNRMIVKNKQCISSPPLLETPPPLPSKDDHGSAPEPVPSTFEAWPFPRSPPTLEPGLSPDLTFSLPGGPRSEPSGRDCPGSTSDRLLALPPSAAVHVRAMAFCSSGSLAAIPRPEAVGIALCLTQSGTDGLGQPLGSLQVKKNILTIVNWSRFQALFAGRHSP